MEFEQIFLSLQKINADIGNPGRRNLAYDFFMRIPKTEENDFKKLSPIDKEVVKLLGQYAINIIEDKSKNIDSLKSLLDTTKTLIVGAAGLRANRLINNIVIELIKKQEDLDKQIQLINHLQEARKTSAIVQGFTSRNIAARQERIKMAENAAHGMLFRSYIDELGMQEGRRQYVKAVDDYYKHSELFNKQKDKLDEIRGDLERSCSQQCVNLIMQLKIEFPIAPWAKYLPKEGGSKKSKTRRRRRHRN
jgi:hypothetical protein